MRARYHYDLLVSRNGDIRDRDNDKPNLARGLVLGKLTSMSRKGYHIVGTGGSPVVTNRLRDTALALFINEIRATQCGAEDPNSAALCTEPKGHGPLGQYIEPGGYGSIGQFDHAENREVFWGRLGTSHFISHDNNSTVVQRVSAKATEHEKCGAENPDYPGEYSCTYPKGHDRISDSMDHGSPEAGAYWKMPEPEGREAWLIKSLQVYRDERLSLEWRAKKISAAAEALQEARLPELARLVTLSQREVELAIDVTKQREVQIQELIDLAKSQ